MDEVKSVAGTGIYHVQLAPSKDGVLDTSSLSSTQPRLSASLDEMLKRLELKGVDTLTEDQIISSIRDSTNLKDQLSAKLNKRQEWGGFPHRMRMWLGSPGRVRFGLGDYFDHQEKLGMLKVKLEATQTYKTDENKPPEPTTIIAVEKPKQTEAEEQQEVSNTATATTYSTQGLVSNASQTDQSDENKPPEPTTIIAVEKPKQTEAEAVEEAARAMYTSLLSLGLSAGDLSETELKTMLVTSKQIFHFEVSELGERRIPANLITFNEADLRAGLATRTGPYYEDFRETLRVLRQTNGQAYGQLSRLLSNGLGLSVALPIARVGVNLIVGTQERRATRANQFLANEWNRQLRLKAYYCLTENRPYARYDIAKSVLNEATSAGLDALELPSERRAEIDRAINPKESGKCPWELTEHLSQQEREKFKKAFKVKAKALLKKSGGTNETELERDTEGLSALALRHGLSEEYGTLDAKYAGLRNLSQDDYDATWKALNKLVDLILKRDEGPIAEVRQRLSALVDKLGDESEIAEAVKKANASAHKLQTEAKKRLEEKISAANGGAKIISDAYAKFEQKKGEAEGIRAAAQKPENKQIALYQELILYLMSPDIKKAVTPLKPLIPSAICQSIGL